MGKEKEEKNMKKKRMFVTDRESASHQLKGDPWVSQAKALVVGQPVIVKWLLWLK